MQGTDKGLVDLSGRPMVSYVVDVLQGNASTVLINANRNIDDYEALGLRVVPDSREGYQGPLAGVEAGLAAAVTPWVYTCPCDSPLQSPALLPRLWQTVQKTGARIVMARDDSRTHPVFSLLDTALLPSLQAYLSSGERKIDRWFKKHSLAEADCSDLADSFINVNTEQERAMVEARLTG